MKETNAYNLVFCDINLQHIYEQQFNHSRKQPYCYRYFGPFSDIFNCFRRMRQAERQKRLSSERYKYKAKKWIKYVSRDTDWCFVNEAEDANIAYDSLIEKYLGIFHTCFPLRT